MKQGCYSEKCNDINVTVFLHRNITDWVIIEIDKIEIVVERKNMIYLIICKSLTSSEVRLNVQLRKLRVEQIYYYYILRNIENETKIKFQKFTFLLRNYVYKIL